VTAHPGRDRAVIPVWTDRHGRPWLDTGKTQPKTGEPIVELADGADKGPLGWVESEFGPVVELGSAR
jgi:hypothetical protein